ncbi:hypothetical protein HYR54_17815 [Candidatus Acetothermia bacterium]|nr:hypothetical protein [Candidatus Acetothermia bacterium]MBI3459441.1 hypothetical protein [Candidatus Acetothermia bacterium]
MSEFIPIFFLIITSYLTLYLTIWLHEVGHALAYWKFGCKKNPWKVRVPFYLFGSTPEPVNDACASSLNSSQQIIVAISGVLVNCLFGVLGLLTISFTQFLPIGLYVFFYCFALAHFIEAGSYLVINSLFLASDTAVIAEHAPRSRWLSLVVASLTLIPATALLVYKASDLGHALFGPTSADSLWQLSVAILSVVVMTIMGIARVIFSKTMDVE